MAAGAGITVHAAASNPGDAAGLGGQQAFDVLPGRFFTISALRAVAPPGPTDD